MYKICAANYYVNYYRVRFSIPYKSLLRMKLIFVLMLSALFQVSAATYGQNVTLSKKNASLNEILDEITRQTGYNFIFSSELNKQTADISLQVTNVDIRTPSISFSRGLT